MKNLPALPLVAIALLALLVAGCGRIREAERQHKQQEEKRAAQEELGKKSAAIWEESSRRKNAHGNNSPGGGTLQVGTRTLHLTSLTLQLGSLKTPGDLQGGQAPSVISGKAGDTVALTIGGVGITAATRAEEVTGQTHEIGAAEDTEIVMSDGSKWRFKDGGINFTLVEEPNVHFVIEGHAIPVSDPKAKPVRVSGELVASVELLPARGAPPPPKP